MTQLLKNMQPVKSGVTVTTMYPKYNTTMTKVKRSMCLGVFIYKIILNREFKGNQECEKKNRKTAAATVGMEAPLG